MKKMCKNSFQIFSSLLFCGLFLFSSVLASAQKDKDTYQKQVDDYLATLDLSGIRNNLLLNKSAFTTDEYERLSIADLRKGNDKIPDVSTLIEQDSKKRSNNNVIPIGILNLDATF